MDLGWRAGLRNGIAAFEGKKRRLHEERLQER
jgi:hypothetical protein